MVNFPSRSKSPKSSENSSSNLTTFAGMDALHPLNEVCCAARASPIPFDSLQLQTPNHTQTLHGTASPDCRPRQTPLAPPHEAELEGSPSWQSHGAAGTVRLPAFNSPIPIRSDPIRTDDDWRRCERTPSTCGAALPALRDARRVQGVGSWVTHCGSV